MVKFLQIWSHCGRNWMSSMTKLWNKSSLIFFQTLPEKLLWHVSLKSDVFKLAGCFGKKI